MAAALSPFFFRLPAILLLASLRLYEVPIRAMHSMRQLWLVGLGGDGAFAGSLVSIADLAGSRDFHEGMQPGWGPGASALYLTLSACEGIPAETTALGPRFCRPE